MQLPNHLVTQISSGNVVLLFANGSARHARNAKDKEPPDEQQLSDLLADAFLTTSYRGMKLSRVAAYAIDESDLATVQDVVRDSLDGFAPTPAHLSVCGYRWKGLATTDWSRIVESAYETSTRRVQRIVPFIDNNDRIEDRLRDPEAIPLLKLRGCITRTHDDKAPLFLSDEPYEPMHNCRSHVLQRLIAWGRESPIIMIGDTDDDMLFRNILNRLDADINSRMRSYIITPEADEIVVRHWEKKNVLVLKGDLADFVTALSDQVTAVFQGLKARLDISGHPISARFIGRNTVLTDSTIRFLETEVDYVNEIKGEAAVIPKDFYRGVNPGWGPILQELDVRRKLADTILGAHVLDVADSPRPTVLLVKGSAGSGKSVLLRRIAWDASHSFESLCLFVREYGLPQAAALDELSEACGERVYIFIDEAPLRTRELTGFLTSLSRSKSNVTVVLSARPNEWNVSCATLSPFVTEEYELNNLSEPEVDKLLALLERHQALGKLSDKSQEERRRYFIADAQRQLLVALHEATLGKVFEDIIRDEYDNIRPDEAKRIYLLICTLNRLAVPVRAGLISRVFGISFEEFKERLFAPLEKIVSAPFDPIERDRMYKARHPHIAQIVFQEVLRTPELRLDEYLKALRGMELWFKSDRDAFDQLIKAWSLIDLFPDADMVEQIYDLAERQGGDKVHIWHQRAIYEMNREDGDLSRAEDYLKKALDERGDNFVVRHSLAGLKLRMVERVTTTLEKNKLLSESESICRSLIMRAKDAVAHTTLIKVGVKRLIVASYDDTGGTDPEIQDAIRKVETDLQAALQLFPGDEYLRAAESELAKALDDSPRATRALELAFQSNQSQPAIAVRLARNYQRSGEIAKAESVLLRALEANDTDKRVNFAYAKLLLDTQSNDGERLRFYLRRSYIAGDINYESQLCHALQFDC